MIALKCPQCQGQLSPTRSKHLFRCEYCGTSFYLGETELKPIAALRANYRDEQSPHYDLFTIAELKQMCREGIIGLATLWDALKAKIGEAFADKALAEIQKGDKSW